MRTVNLLSLLLLPFFLMGQQPQNNLRPGYTTFGINAGKAYQSSDIRNGAGGFGLGLTLGKNLFYAPDAALSFDLRSRLLYARSLGQDPFRTYNIGNNSALNGEKGADYTDYPDAFGLDRGFAFQNHRTDLGELGLEGVITFNRLKEASGVKLSLYGGAGLDWYQVRTDQLDAHGKAYFDGYAGINERAPRHQILGELEGAILDGNFETVADGFENRSGRLGIMPSVGAEVGFQVSPGFSIDFGHRLTFPGNDLLDGSRWEDGGNDLHHYTYAGLNFNINKRERTIRPPRIKLIRPTQTYLSTREPNMEILAKVEGVERATDIRILRNGLPVPFSFNRENLRANGLLDPGRNEFILTAVNAAGSDQAKLVIHMEEVFFPDPPVRGGNPATDRFRPEVRIMHPTVDGQLSRESRITLEAGVRYVANKNAIRLMVNGQALGFFYDRSRDRLEADLKLEPGENQVVVEAWNEIGTATDQISIRFEPAVPAPRVRIVRPADGFRTENSTVELLAEVNGIDHSRQLVIELNGRQLLSFEHRGNQVRTELWLEPGRNELLLRAANESGTARDQVTIYLDEPLPETYPPTVEISEPVSGSLVREPKLTIRANTSHISATDHYEVRLNGRILNDLSLLGDRLTARAMLREGSNELVVSVRNTAGSDRDETRVTFIKPESPPARPPVITVLNPTAGSVLPASGIRLEVRTLHVARKSDLRLRMNGKTIHSFRWEGERLLADVVLREGTNTFHLEASNADGKDIEEWSVQYRAPVRYIPKPPVVRISEPGNNSRTTEEKVNFRALVREVSDKKDIELWVNDKKAYAFARNGETVSAVIRLQEGLNLIRIKATNTDGEAEESVRLVYERPRTQAVAPPTVTFLQPATDGTETANSSTNFDVRITGIRQASQLEVRINGVRFSTYSFDPASGRLKAKTALRKGENTITVAATNEGGRDSGTRKITRRKAKEIPAVTLPKPEISILSISQPTVNPMNPSSARSSLSALVRHVEETAAIEVRINQTAIGDFGFDPKTGKLQATLPLQPGDNELLIRATNSSGTSEIRKTILLDVTEEPRAPVRGPGGMKSVPAEPAPETDNGKDRPGVRAVKQAPK